MAGDAAHVELPSLFPRLTAPNSQLLFGRQGSGKSHLLLSLLREATPAQLPVYVDLKNIGAISDLFEEQPEATLSARATRLAVDVLAAVHSVVHRQAEAAETMDEQVASWLDALADAITQVKVSGSEERSESVEAQSSDATGLSAEIQLSGAGPGAKVGLQASGESGEKTSTAITQRGHADVWLHLASVREALEGLTNNAGPILLLIDDWSFVPIELQPWLADVIRRIFWDAPGCVVKIAAIRADSRFLINTERGLVGLNHRDANVLDLDNPAEAALYRSQEFVVQLLYEHAMRATLSSTRRNELPDTAEEFAETAFEPAALTALVEASEGNPRDALILGAQAATHAGAGQIAEHHVLRAARALLIDYKDLAAMRVGLGEWLVSKVCGRSSRSFYLERSSESIPGVLRAMHGARLVHQGEGVLNRVAETGFTTLFQEWHVDYSLAAYLAEETFGAISAPPPPTAYEDIEEAPVLRIEDFQQTVSWLIEPRGQGYRVQHVWANGPPAWVKVVAAGLDPDGQYLIVDAGSAVESVPLERSPMQIGRAEADIRIVDPTVSRRHAKLYKSGNTWRVVDENSRNGTVVNGVKVPWRELSSGDIMVVGKVVLLYLET